MRPPSKSVGRREFIQRAALGAGGLTLLARCSSNDALRRATRPVRLAIPSDPSTLDVARADDNVAQRIGRLIGDGLVEIGPDLDFVPALARSWSFEDEGRSLVVELDDRRRWHDGRPVTIDDLVYTWQTMSDPEQAIESLRDPFVPIVSIEPAGGGRATIRYERPFPGALHGWRWPLLPAHDERRATRPIGCGPWRFAEWITGERVILEANAEHPEWAPSISSMHLEVIQGYGPQLDGLLADRIDVAALYPDAWKRYRDDGPFNERFDIHAFRTPYFFYIAWLADGSNPYFDDARVRRAMTHAIPREEYLEKVAFGLGTPGVTCFHPDLWAYDASIAPWPHDKERAGALLDEAGWRLDSEGRRTKGGRPFRFKFSYSAGSAETERIAAFVQAALAEVGVEVVLDPHEWSVLSSRVDARDYEAVMLGRYLELDPDPYGLLHSSQADAGANYAGLRNPRIDALIEEGRATADRDRRTRAYHELQALVHEEEPLTILFYPRSRVAATKDLEGFSVSSLGYLEWRPGPSNWRWRT